MQTLVAQISIALNLFQEVDMKLIHKGAQCYLCGGGRQSIRFCPDCERWYCWQCFEHDKCPECHARELAEREAGIPRLKWHEPILWDI